MLLSPSSLLGAAFGPISYDSITSKGQTTVDTTADLLFADLTQPRRDATRRVYVHNRDSSIEIGIVLARAGATIASLGISDAALRIPASEWRAFVVTGDTRVGIVAASGTPAFDYYVSDR